MTHPVYQKTIVGKLSTWLKRQSRRLKPEWLEAALILIRLNLDPARHSLHTLSSPSPRGRRPYDPICMLRALILMVTLHYTRIESFANDLRSHPRLALLAGFAPFKTPAVGTFSLFLDRFEDGPYQPSCPHRITPSRLRKGKHRRNLKKEKATKEQRKKHILAECDSLTQTLKDDLLHASDQPRPDDLLTRLEDLLITCAVTPSAQRGLLGDLKQLILSGDGSALVTGVSPHGKPTCSCRREGISPCDHDRFYSDPSADWGYDAYRECYYFGHTFSQHTVSICGHDLPLHILLGPASETDFTLSLKRLDRLEKAFRENGL
ncbi:MAG: transposase, partial [Candidatus Tectomicrobia bacterium]|nr:transposase [Candidatus Tectomicrobia bacterium]